MFTDCFGSGQKTVEEGHAAGPGVCFLAPLFADIGPGLEVVAEGMSTGGWSRAGRERGTFVYRRWFGC